MTATHIVIDEFIDVLSKIRANGTRLINLDMIPDDNHPSMNKLVIHPVPVNAEQTKQASNTRRLIIKNPDISTDNNDIFDSFNNIL